jgi:hypothetical protein
MRKNLFIVVDRSFAAAFAACDIRFPAVQTRKVKSSRHAKKVTTRKMFVGWSQPIELSEYRPSAAVG